MSFCRPDLVDWTKIRKRAVRERLETAFFLAEREFGVTRLLDVEGECLSVVSSTDVCVVKEFIVIYLSVSDVDTNEPDEKSLITYISSMYETFPEPPQQHPLHDGVRISGIPFGLLLLVVTILC